MKLQNKLKHMRGMGVSCNGTIYKLDDEGVVEVKDKADIEKLFSAAEWAPYKTPKKGKVPKAAKSQIKKSVLSEAPIVLDPVLDPVPDPEQELVEGETTDTIETLEDPDSTNIPTTNDEAEAENNDDSVGEGPEIDPDEWPDPEVSMKKEYLQDMADAYDIEYEDKTTKTKLVELIQVKMYE